MVGVPSDFQGATGVLLELQGGAPSLSGCSRSLPSAPSQVQRLSLGIGIPRQADHGFQAVDGNGKDQTGTFYQALPAAPKPPGAPEGYRVWYPAPTGYCTPNVAPDLLQVGAHHIHAHGPAPREFRNLLGSAEAGFKNHGASSSRLGAVAAPPLPSCPCPASDCESAPGQFPGHRPAG